MQRLSLPLQKGIIYVLFFICLGKIGYGQQAQTLKLSDFAIWGGSASPTSYNSFSRRIPERKSESNGQYWK